MARERQERSLAEGIYDGFRADILFGQRLPASRLQLHGSCDLQMAARVTGANDRQPY